MATKKNDSEPQLPPDAVERAGVIAPIRLASLALAAKLEAAKLRSLKLERARLLARHGEKSTELERIDTVFDAHVAAVKTGLLEIQRARVPPLQPGKENAVIHGRVVDVQGKGVKAVTVTAHDAEGKAIATSKSDDAGYYHMKLASPEAATKPKVSLRTSAKSTEPQDLELMPGLLAIVDMLVKD